MSILVDKNTRVLVQGITGADGAFHAAQLPRVRHAGRRRRHARQGRARSIEGVPVFDTVAEAVRATGANASRDLRAAARSPPTRSSRRPTPASPLVVCITEGIPVARHGRA